MFTKSTIALLSTLILISLASTDGIFGKENSQNKIKVEVLKERVLPYIPSTSTIHQFRNDDLYWLKWLQDNSFNLNKTTNNFFTNLQWRQKEKMDTIHLEDWTYFENEYPEFHDTVDKMGRPIVEVWFSDWDIRRAVISGKRRQLLRWMIYNVEMGMRNLFISRVERNNSAEGVIEIMDYSEVNLLTQGCASCVSIYEALQRTIPQHYPGILQEIILVNVRSAHRFVLNVWKKTFSTSTNISLYGREVEWSLVLINKISKDQLSIRFGGTKIRYEKQ